MSIITHEDDAMNLSRSTGRIRTVIDATRAAIANPGDTAQVFRIAEALSFRNPERMRARFAADADGARLLESREELLEILGDHGRLAAMPEGSLGRAYLAFLEREQITADGLVEASEAGAAGQYDNPADDDLAFIRRRMRDTHDLWHVVTGYHGDLLGEAALLAFTFAQTGHVGIGFLAGVGAALSFNAFAIRMIAEGYVRGRRARWLAPTDWARLLPLPIDEVRHQLGVVPVGEYPEVRDFEVPRRLFAR